MLVPRGFYHSVVTLITAVSISAQANSLSSGSDDFSSMSLKQLVALDVFTSASLLPTQISKAPGTVYSFHRDDFNAYGVRRIDDLLAFVPGLQLNQYRKRHRSVWARGLLERYNDKMVLMVDGVRMRHLYYNHFSLGDSFPMEMVEKVEVILGPASSLYGANAFGGIISITTRQFSEQPNYAVTAEMADNARSKVTGLYNSEDLQIFGSFLEQDAPFREDRLSFIGSDVLQPRDEHYGVLNIKASPMEGLNLQLNYQRDETPFLNIPATQDAFVSKDFLSVSASYVDGTLDTGQIEAVVYYQDDQGREFEVEQITRALGYEEYQNATLAGASLTAMKRFDEHTLASGVSWQYEKAERTDYERFFHFAHGFLSPSETGNLLSEPGVSNNDWAAFFQDVWTIDPTLNLTLGGRYDYFDQFGGHFNYRAAAVYSPDDRQTWKMQYGTAIRTPTFREYLKVLEGTTFVPPQTKPEEIESLEFGYLYQWDQANLSLNLYRNELTGYIREVPTPDMADEYFANSGTDITMQGADLLFHIRPARDLDLRLGLAYLHSDSEGEELPYLASWTGSVKLNYHYHKRHSIGLSAFYNSQRDDFNSFLNDTADEFWITNLFAYGQLSDQFSYRLGIDNLFDKRVYDPAADFGSQHNNERSQREIWLSVEWNSDFL
ncbi:TonB-dependent receptor [uncultured Neptuniibacter sp.]|uniref:TonB-dependent receptor plug domain-containing protein n=1 Tax=uncultured Neptuniibacter sp. TaxID=502143 RepID=UPI00263153C5|nr:TonB-dependent receptor [uncultured Neptuniibacter sp.]